MTQPQALKLFAKDGQVCWIMASAHCFTGLASQGSWTEGNAYDYEHRNRLVWLQQQKSIKLPGVSTALHFSVINALLRGLPGICTLPLYSIGHYLGQLNHDDHRKPWNQRLTRRSIRKPIGDLASLIIDERVAERRRKHSHSNRWWIYLIWRSGLFRKTRFFVSIHFYSKLKYCPLIQWMNPLFGPDTLPIPRLHHFLIMPVCSGTHTIYVCTFACELSFHTSVIPLQKLFTASILIRI